MKAKAIVRLPFPNQKQLAAVVDALAPEVQRQIGMRSKTALTLEGDVLVLAFEAEDTVALRAAMNSYLRWINSTINVIKALEENR